VIFEGLKVIYGSINGFIVWISYRTAVMWAIISTWYCCIQPKRPLSNSKVFCS